jgi:hypothetical protein
MIINCILWTNGNSEISVFGEMGDWVLFIAKRAVVSAMSW